MSVATGLVMAALMEGNSTTSPPPLSVPKAWKLGILPAIFFITLVPSIGPWIMLCLCSKKHLALSFSFAGCLAAGILLGAGLCNILPEATENWNEYFEYRGITSRVSGFPWASAIAGMVVFLLVSLEHMLITAGASHSHKGEDDSDSEEAPGESTPILIASKAETKKANKKEKKHHDQQQHHDKTPAANGNIAPEHGAAAGHQAHEHQVPEWHNKQEHHHHQRRIITGTSPPHTHSLRT